MRSIPVIICLFASLLLSATKEPKETRLTVEVLSSQSGKPIDRASVVVNFRHGVGVNLKKVLTNWETKTNQSGRVTIPGIPQGEVTVQVIASDFQTAGDVYQLTQPEQLITIKLNRPQAQYSEDAKRNAEKPSPDPKK